MRYFELNKIKMPQIKMCVLQLQQFLEGYFSH